MTEWKYNVRGVTADIANIIKEGREMKIVKGLLQNDRISHDSNYADALKNAEGMEFLKQGEKGKESVFLAWIKLDDHWHALRVMRSDTAPNEEPPLEPGHYWYEGAIVSLGKDEHKMEITTHNGTWHGSGN